MQTPSDSCATCGHVKHRIVIVSDLMPPNIYTVECGYCGSLRLMRLNAPVDKPVDDTPKARSSYPHD